MQIGLRAILGVPIVVTLLGCSLAGARLTEPANAHQLSQYYYASTPIGVDSLLDSLTIQVRTADGAQAVPGVWLRAGASTGVVTPTAGQADGSGLVTFSWRTPRPTRQTLALSVCEVPNGTTPCGSDKASWISHSP